MNNFDVAGLLMTYAEKCRNASNSEKLKDIIRDLKMEFDAKEIKKLKVE